MNETASTFLPASLRDPCRICTGHPGLRRGQGIRCSGKRSADGGMVGCSREEHAGGLQPKGGGLYWHRMRGRCDCGTQHGEAVTTERAARRIVAEFPFENADRTLRYQEVKYEPKDFRLRRPDPSAADGWNWSLAGITRIPYRLPDLLEADPARPVLIPEGPKDTDRARSMGFVASCNSEGAGKFRPELAPYFRGRHVVIIPDNDKPGADHADQVAAVLLPVAASLRVVHLPGLPPHGDLSDWVSAGGTADELQALIDAAPNWLEAKAIRILQEQLQRETARADEAERRCVVLERRHRTNFRMTQNKAVKKYAPVALAIANAKQGAIDRGADPAAPVLIRRREIARVAGISANTTTNHIKEMEARGWCKRSYGDHKPGTVLIDRETGEANDDPMTDLLIDLPEDVNAWLEELSEYRLDRPEKRGGYRPSCEHCGYDAPSTTEHIETCDHCGHERGRSTSHSTHHRQTPTSAEWQQTAQTADPLPNFGRGSPVPQPSTVVNVSPMLPKFGRGPILSRCRDCGGPVDKRDPRCPPCLERFRYEQATAYASTDAAAGGGK